MGKKQAASETLIDLLYQALETEQGGIEVYETALTCVNNESLHEEFSEYLEQTRTHERALLAVFSAMGLDPSVRPPSRAVVGTIGAALVEAMKLAKANGTPEQAELVACECVVLAETKDHANWELLGHVAEHSKGPFVPSLRQAVEQVEDQEDRHLYHSKGWMRELAIQALGLPAVIPPPEERKDVETAIGASRAEHARKDYL